MPPRWALGYGLCEYGFLHLLGQVDPIPRAEGHCPPMVDICQTSASQRSLSGPRRVSVGDAPGPGRINPLNLLNLINLRYFYSGSDSGCLLLRGGPSPARSQSTCPSISRPPSGAPACELFPIRHSPVGGGERSREKGITSGQPPARLRVSGTNVGSGLEC